MVKDSHSRNPLIFAQPFGLWNPVIVLASIRSAYSNVVNILIIFNLLSHSSYVGQIGFILVCLLFCTNILFFFFYSSSSCVVVVGVFWHSSYWYLYTFFLNYMPFYPWNLLQLGVYHQVQANLGFLNLEETFFVPSQAQANWVFFIMKESFGSTPLDLLIHLNPQNYLNLLTLICWTYDRSAQCLNGFLELTIWTQSA